MADVSVPPTHPDDDLVSRRILREELANYPTRKDLEKALAKHPTREDLEKALADIATQFRSMGESIIAKMTALLEPSTDHGPRITRLEARTSVLAARADALESARTVRRPKRSTRKRAARK